MRGSLLRGLFPIVCLCIKGFENRSDRLAKLVVFFGEKKGLEVFLELLSISNDLEIEFLHFLSELEVHLVDLGVEFLMLPFQVFLSP